MTDCFFVKSYTLYYPMFIFFENCSAKIHINGQVKEIKKNTIIFLKKNLVIDVSISGEPPIILKLTNECINKLARDISHIHDVNFFNESNFISIEKRIDLVDSSIINSIFSDLKINDYLMDCNNKNLYNALLFIALNFGDELHNLIVNSARPTLFDRVVNLVSSDLSKKWTLSYIAEELCVSEILLRKHLEGKGVLFSKMLLDLRMRKAISLILNTDKKINIVSSLLGYSQTSYFIKIFKVYFGCTPKQLELKINKSVVQSI